jgi:hypothetical protein
MKKKYLYSDARVKKNQGCNDSVGVRRNHHLPLTVGKNSVTESLIVLVGSSMDAPIDNSALARRRAIVKKRR